MAEASAAGRARTSLPLRRLLRDALRIDRHDLPAEGSLLTALAGFALLGAVVVLPVLVVLAIGESLGTALGARPDGAVGLLVTAIIESLLGVTGVVCGVLGAGRGRLLGWLWAALSLVPAGVALLVVYDLVTSTTGVHA